MEPGDGLLEGVAGVRALLCGDVRRTVARDPGPPLRAGIRPAAVARAAGAAAGVARPRRVFVNSMSDLFHEEIPDEFIERVFDVMARARLAHLPGADQAARRVSALARRLAVAGERVARRHDREPAVRLAPDALRDGPRERRVHLGRAAARAARGARPARDRLADRRRRVGARHRRLDLDWVTGAARPMPGTRTWRSSSSRWGAGLRRPAGGCWTAPPGTSIPAAPAPRLRRPPVRPARFHL